MAIKQLSEQEYAVALKDFKHISFMQSVEMGILHKNRQHAVYYLAYTVAEQVKVLALVFSQKLFGGVRMELNAGPICHDVADLPEFYQALKRFAKKQGCLELVIKPNHNYSEHTTNGDIIGEPNDTIIAQLKAAGFKHDGLTVGYPNGEAFWHYVKDLSGLTPETLAASFIPKAKSLSKKIATFGMTIRQLDKTELVQFKQITEQTSDRRSYSDKPMSYYEQFYDAFGETCEFLVASINFQFYANNLAQERQKLADKLADIAQKLLANPNSTKQNNVKKEYEDQLRMCDIRLEEATNWLQKYGTQEVILAAGLFVYTPDETCYLFSGSNTEFNKFYAPVALQEYTMKRSLEKGIPTYNFYGVQGVFDGSDGVLKYKQNFNGYIVRKAGVFHYYPNQWKYTCITWLKKLLRR